MEHRRAITGEAPGRDAWSERVRAGSAAAQEPLRDVLRTSRSGESRSDFEPGVALRKVLLDPLEHAFDGATTLILAPEGEIALVPFQVLPLSDGRRLLEKYRVTYVGSGRDVLKFGRASPVAAAAPIVVADPDYDLGLVAGAPAAGDLYFGRLSGTATEERRLHGGSGSSRC